MPVRKCLSCSRPTRGSYCREHKDRPYRDVYYRALYRLAKEKVGETCPLCNKPMDKNKHRPSVDHIKPIGYGGSNSPENLRIVGLSCNTSR